MADITYPYDRTYFVGARINDNGEPYAYAQSLRVFAPGVERELDPVPIDLAGEEFEAFRALFGASQSKRIASLEQEITSSRQSVETLSHQLKTAESIVKGITAENESLALTIATLEPALDEAKTEVSKLTNQLSLTTSVLNDSNEAIIALGEKHDTATARIDQILDELTTVRAEVEKLKPKAERCEMIETQNALLRAALSAAQSEREQRVELSPTVESVSSDTTK